MSRSRSSAELITGGLLALPLAFLLTLSQTSAEPYVVSGLSFPDYARPLEVTAGENVSLSVTDEEPLKYIRMAGSPNGERVQWRSQREGGPNASGAETGLVPLIALTPGNWTYSFESRGKVMIAVYLPELCGWTASTADISEGRCPVLQLTNATAFMLMTWALDRPYFMEIGGDVDALFFDEWLNPNGAGTERRYEKTIEDLVVVIPRGEDAEVSFTFSPVKPGFDLSTTTLVVATLGMLVFALWIIRRHRKRRDGQHLGRGGETLTGISRAKSLNRKRRPS